MPGQVHGLLELLAVSLLHEGGNREVMALRRVDRVGRLAEGPVHHDAPRHVAACVELELAVGSVLQLVIDAAIGAVGVRLRGRVLVVRAQLLREGEDDVAEAPDGDVAGLHPVRQIHRNRPLSG